MKTVKKLIITTLGAILVSFTAIRAALPEQSDEHSSAQSDEEHKNESAASQESDHLSLENRLFEAICQQDTQAVVTYLQAGANTNTLQITVDSHGNEQQTTPLVAALCSRNTSILEQLLTYKANVNFIDNSDYTPLKYALSARDSTLVNVLLQNKARIDSVDSTGTPALRHAIAQKTPCHPDIIKLLVKHKASVNALDNQGNTPLSVASTLGYSEIVQALIDCKADVNLKNDFAGTPLMYATWRNHPETAQLLLEHKANVDARNKQGESSLYMAVTQKSNAVVSLLLVHKARADLPVDGIPPLQRALHYLPFDHDIIKTFVYHFLDGKEVDLALDHLIHHRDTPALFDDPALLQGKLTYHQLPVIQQKGPDCSIHALANAASINKCFKTQQPIDSNSIKEHHSDFHYLINGLISAINPYKNNPGTSAIDLITVAKQHMAMDNCVVLTNKNNTLTCYITSQPFNHIRWGIPDCSGPITHNPAIIALIDNLKSKDSGAVHFLCDIELIRPGVPLTGKTNHTVTISLIKDSQVPHSYIAYMESNNYPLESQPDAQRWINFINAYYGNRLLEQ